MATKSVAVEAVVWKDGGRDVDKAHVKELAASIEKVGLLEPILVVQGVGSGGADVYEGRAGRHRWEAVKSLGLKTIDVQVLDLGPEAQRLARIEENLRRKDLNPIERAREFAGYLELRRAQDPKVTQEAVGKELRVSGPEMSNTLMLLEQPKGVQDSLRLGSLTPGHVEHVLAPLVRTLQEKGATEKEAAAIAEKFGFDVARGKARGYGQSKGVALDIRTAKEEAAHWVREYAAAKLSADLQAEMGRLKVKVRRCPVQHCGWDPDQPKNIDYRFEAKVYEAEGRTVVAHGSYGGETHRWYGDTGEFYYTPAEQKQIERDDIAARRARKVAAKKAPMREKVDRDYAVFFSRAPIARWAHAVLDELDEHVSEIAYNAGHLELRAGGWTKLRVRFHPVSLADGNGAAFPTRVVLLGTGDAGGETDQGYYSDTHGSRYGFSARSNQVDNVAEGPDAKVLRKIRREVLEFQRKVIKVKQADDDLWPVEVGPFKLGEKVRIGAKSNVKSYVGKQGVILAFDTDYTYDRSGKDKQVFAVLDIAASTKHHPVSVLEKIEARDKKGAKA